MNSSQKTKPSFKQLLEPLNGKTFTEEDLQTAVLMAFSPYQDCFPGEPYHIVIEAGRKIGWITNYDNGLFKISIPEALRRATAPLAAVLITTPEATELTFREIHLLVELASTRTGTMENNGVCDPDFTSLIQKGFVEYVPMAEPEANDDLLRFKRQQRKEQAIQLLLNDDYDAVHDAVYFMQDITEQLETHRFVHRFTSKGQEFMRKQIDSRSHVPNC